jgi:ABC-type lipoprotein release transport system permease subunit
MHDLRLAFRNLVRKPAFSVIAALLASFVPARRAARISPLAALGR